MINIRGLSKKKVLVALYNNVYLKSETAKSAFISISHQCKLQHSIPSLGSFGLSEEDAMTILEKHNSIVTTAGCVIMNIDFSGEHIDTTEYDQTHKTDRTRGVMTAADCIEHLRNTLDAQHNNFLLKEEIQRQQNKLLDECNDFLRVMLNNNDVILRKETDSRFSISCLPELTDAYALQYANQLLSLEIGIKLEKSHGFFTSTLPPQLLILDQLDALHKKLQEESMKPKAAWCRMM